MPEPTTELQEAPTEQKVTPKLPQPTFAQIKPKNQTTRTVVSNQGKSVRINIDPQQGPEIEGLVEEHKGWEEIERKSLELQTYGHQDVIECFRGDIPKEEGRKYCILALGGGNGGASLSAGMMKAMYDAGVFQRADGVVGVSAGAAAGFYTASGQNEAGAKVLEEDNTNKDRFIKFNSDSRLKNIWRIANGFLFNKGPQNPLMDTRGGPIDSMRNGDRKFDVVAFKEKETKIGQDFWVVITNKETGLPEYANAVTGLMDDGSVADSDPINIMDAAICVPAASSIPAVKLENGKEYIDGGASDFLPIDWAFAHGYTDVLVLASGPIIPNPSVIEKVKMRLAGGRGKSYGYSKRLIDEVKGTWDNIRADATHINDIIGENDPMKRVAVIEATDESMSDFVETNRHTLWKAYREAIYHTGQIFAPQNTPTRQPITTK